MNYSYICMKCGWKGKFGEIKKKGYCPKCRAFGLGKIKLKKGWGTKGGDQNGDNL